jgi:hypothetical protein
MTVARVTGTARRPGKAPRVRKPRPPSRGKRGPRPRGGPAVDLHAIGRRWVEDGDSLIALSRALGCAYSTLYGKLRALGYTLEAAPARPGGRGPRAEDRVRQSALAGAEQRWATALAGKRFADARVPPPRGRPPQAVSQAARQSSLADL